MARHEVTGSTVVWKSVAIDAKSPEDAAAKFRAWNEGFNPHVVETAAGDTLECAGVCDRCGVETFDGRGNVGTGAEWLCPACSNGVQPVPDSGGTERE